MQEILKNKIRVDGELAILQNYQKTDNIQDFFEYCHSIGVKKYVILDMFGSKYIYTENGTLKNVPEDGFDLIENHLNLSDSVSDDNNETNIIEEVPSAEEYVEPKTYTEEEYNEIKSKNEKLEEDLKAKENELLKYSLGIEFFDKVYSLAEQHFQAKLNEKDKLIEEANRERDEAIAKLESYKEKISAILS